MKKKIYFTSKPNKIGGGGTFQIGFQKWLSKNTEYRIDYLNFKNKKKKHDIVFIMHGTKKIISLLFHKIFGNKIILRMDGFFEDYRFQNPFYTLNGLKHNLSCLYSIVIADKIIMQSNFSYNHLSFVSKIFKHKISIIRNGVNLNTFKPKKNNKKIFNKILITEGGIVSEYAKNIIESLSIINLFPVSIYGKIHKILKKKVRHNNYLNIKFHGAVKRGLMPKVYQNHDIFICAEHNSTCPNSVLEAMSSGLPIIGFDNGSLKELVGDAGLIIKLEKKLENTDKEIIANLLKKSIKTISGNYIQYSQKARERAKTFDANLVFDKYFKILTIN
tara:strand:+ start:938 stop:1930 length:993 start_codon:yes stop_codon:yes gene_type:complete